MIYFSDIKDLVFIGGDYPYRGGQSYVFIVLDDENVRPCLVEAYNEDSAMTIFAEHLRTQNIETKEIACIPLVANICSVEKASDGRPMIYQEREEGVYFSEEAKREIPDLGVAPYDEDNSRLCFRFYK